MDDASPKVPQRPPRSIWPRPRRWRAGYGETDWRRCWNRCGRRDPDRCRRLVRVDGARQPCWPLVHLLLVALLQLHLQVLPIHWEAVHTRDGGRGRGGCSEGHEAKTTRAALGVSLHAAANDLPKVLEMLPHDRVVPTVRNVVNEQVGPDRPRRARSFVRVARRVTLLLGDGGYHLRRRGGHCLRLRLGVRWHSTRDAEDWPRPNRGRTRGRRRNDLEPLTTDARHGRSAGRQAGRRRGREFWRGLCPRGLASHGVVIVELALLRPSFLPRALLVVRTLHWSVKALP
mmetsp:Transcript_83010/g.231716  ORF Transcript_83010/g.231716 Transcript_83010/m.231716 type:complete len:287 (-) Transcript_83010:316-1176(-)